MQLPNAGTAIERLSVIWKSIKKKKQILPNSGWVNPTLWMHHTDADRAYRENARRELQKKVSSFTEQIQAALRNKTAGVRTLSVHR